MGVISDGGEAKVVAVADVGEATLMVHDETRPDPSIASMLSRLARGPFEPTPVGVFRAIDAPEYAYGMQQQLLDEQARRGPGDLGELLRSGGTWTV